MTRFAALGAATAALILVIASGAHADPNLIVNGDFEAGVGPGGLTGFASDYTYATCPYPAASACQEPESTIYVNTDPNLDHPAWSSFAAESGSNMLIVNGGSNPSAAVWREPSIAVTPYQTYQFTGWVAATYTANPGVLALNFNGAGVGAPFTVSTTTGLWQ